MKKIVILIIWLLLIGAMNLVLLNADAVDWKNQLDFEEGWWSNAAETFFYAAKRSAYIGVGYAKATDYKNLFKDNLLNFISMNPSPVQSTTLRDAMGFFINLLQPFYVLGILIASFYLLFVSASPEDRYRIKSMLTKLIAGMIVISLSPAILQLFLSLSEGLTRVILGLTNVDIFLAVMDDLLDSLKWYFAMLTVVAMDIGFYALLPIMGMVWGIFTVLFLRYVIVTLFCIIFPLIVFLYSFEFTRGLGRNMLEQMILWTVIQQFNAVFLAVAAVCIATRPENFMVIIPSGLPLPDIDFLALVSSLAFVMAPLLVLRLFRNFLP